MKNTTSLAKTESNRRNALLSTGPKTNEGKQITKWNALKHGILSREAVITAGDGRESQLEFDEMLAGLVDNFRPVGAVEEMLVDKIAVSYWRLRRAVRCEVGEIRKQTDLFHTEREAEATRVPEPPLIPELPGPAYEQLVQSPAGIEHLLRILAELRRDVRKHGEFSESASKKMLEAFAGDQIAVDLAYYSAFIPERGREEALEDWDVDGEPPTPEECRKAILRIISWQTKQLKRRLPEVRARDRLRAESHLARLSLPPDHVSERIRRYETAIERSLYRAIHELQRLQSARIGHNVPDPFVLHVDTASDSE